MAGNPDVEVCRDQLPAELDRDLGRGLIQPFEAEQAPIGCRLLRANDAGNEREGIGEGTALRLVSAAAVLAVPLVSWGP